MFCVSIKEFLYPTPNPLGSGHRETPSTNAHTYRLLIFKEQATNTTTHPGSWHVDRNVVHFVAPLCQQQRSEIMGMTGGDVKPLGRKIFGKRPPWAFRSTRDSPQNGSRSQSANNTA